MNTSRWLDFVFYQNFLFIFLQILIGSLHTPFSTKHFYGITENLIADLARGHDLTSRHAFNQSERIH